MNKKTLLVAISSLALIAIVGLAVVLFPRSPRYNGTVYPEPYPPAPNFQLTSTQGGNLALTDLRGHVTMIFFGYTNCPDECPTTMAKIKLALASLDNQSSDIDVLFVTTDPVRDSVGALNDFLSHFNPAFIGLTGSTADLQKAWDSYGVYVAEGGAAHSNRIYVVDRQGNLRLTFPYDMDSDAMASDLKILLGEG